MERARTPCRNLIFILRVAAGIFGSAGLACYAVILSYVLHDYDASGWGFTTLPLLAGGIILAWNILSILLMFRTRPLHLFLAIGDFFIFVVAAALGIIGFYHDNMTYLKNGQHYSDYGYSAWLQIEEIGAVMLLIAVVIQILLVVFNFLEYRHIKRASRRTSLPPYYSGYTPAVVEKKDDFELDWRSVLSEKFLPSVAKKSTTAEV